MSEALAKEVERFGIKVTLVEPAGYATAWGTTSMRFAPSTEPYDALRSELAEPPGPRQPRAVATREGRSRALVSAPRHAHEVRLGLPRDVALHEVRQAARVLDDLHAGGRERRLVEDPRREQRVRQRL